MSTLVVNGVPDNLRDRLQEEAARNHRSVDREVCIILSAHLSVMNLDDIPPPVRVDPPPTNESLARLKRGELE